MKVLVADDSVSMRQMVTIMLNAAGHTVVETSDGRAALAAFDGSVDLVITDFNMPDVGGVELIRTIRGGSAKPSVPIIILTTESEAARREEGRAAGATAWITKPFTRESLIGTIDKIMGAPEF